MLRAKGVPVSLVSTTIETNDGTEGVSGRLPSTEFDKNDRYSFHF